MATALPPSLSAQARDVSTLRFQLVQEAQRRSQLESALLNQRAEAASASAAAAHALELQRSTSLRLQEQLDDLRSRIAASPSTQPPASAISLPAGPVVTAPPAPIVAAIKPPDPVQFDLASALEAKASQLQEANASLSRAISARDGELGHLRVQIQQCEEEKKALAADLESVAARVQAQNQGNKKPEDQLALHRKLALAEAEIETLRKKVYALSQTPEERPNEAEQVPCPKAQPDCNKLSTTDVGVGEGTVISIEDEGRQVDTKSLLEDEIKSLELAKRTLEKDQLKALRALREALNQKEELTKRVKRLENSKVDNPGETSSKLDKTVGKEAHAKQRILELEKKIETLSFEKLEMEQERQASLETIDDLKAQVRVSQAGIEEYKQLFEDARRDKISVSESMKRALETSEKQLLDVKKKDANQREDLERTIASMESKLDTVTRERDQSNELVQDLDSAREEMTDVIRRLSDEKKELESQLESALTSSAAASAEAERAARENKNLADEVRAIDQEKDRIVAEIDTMSEKLVKVEEERDALRSERADIIDELTRLKGEMKKQKENFELAETREERLEEKMSSTKAEIRRLQDSLLSREAQLEAAVEDLAAATREQQVVNGEMTKVSEDLKKTASELAEAENQLQVMDSSMDSLRRENKQLESAYKDLERDLKRAYGDIGASDSQISSLRRQIDIHEKNNLELDYECQRLQARLSEVDRTASSYRSTMDDLVREIEVREQELSKSLDARKELEHELLSARDAISIKESQCQDLQHKLAAATFENQRKGQSAMDNEAEAAATQIALNSLQREKIHLEGIIADLRQESIKARRDAGVLKGHSFSERSDQKDHSALESQVSRLQGSISSLESENATVLPDKADLVMENERIFSLLGRMDMEKQQLVEQLSVQRHEKGRIEAQLELLRKAEEGSSVNQSKTIT